MSKEITHAGHTITVLPQGSAFSVRISGPRVNSRAGVFATEEAAVAYAKERIDVPMTPEEKSEIDFMAGNKAAYRSLLAEALRQLVGDPELGPAQAVLQLHDARVQAKLLCERIGVEYSPDLHLADIIEKRIGRYMPARFLNVSFIPPSPFREALDLIGPARDEDHFHVRLCLAALLLRPILDSYQDRAIQVDPRTKKADVRAIEAELASALAGTEFTAKVLQPDGADRLVVDLEPKEKEFAPHPFSPSGNGITCALCGDSRSDLKHGVSP